MKKLFYLVFATIIAITASFGESVFAADTNNKSLTFSNGNVGHSYHWLAYVDTKCGMNTVAKYSGSSNSNVNKMEVDWTAYNITGTEQDWGNGNWTNTKYIYDKSRTAVLGKSYAAFEFVENSQTWKPKGYVYHCGMTSSSLEATKIASLNATENPNMLPTKYKDLWKSKKGISTKSLTTTSPETEITKETLEEYYLEDIEEFKLDNGNTVTADNFRVDKSIKVKGSHFEDKDLKLEFSDLPEDTNITYIKSSVPQKVYQEDGKAFNLQAYIVVSDSAASNEDALDFGFLSTPVK
ncbi:hypothetical protein ACFRH9_28685 [Peribacillus butanolivorans]|uniref:hypothetical protein n=1 Tax=Peribacillus butanolivorans TaxID=421767 RepID=UPI00366FAD44